MSFIQSIDIDTDPNTNFWETNPHLKHLPPYANLYQEYEDQMQSSNMMWYIVFIHEADDQVNPYFRLSEEKVIAMLEDRMDIEVLDFGNETFQKCIEDYQHTCLSVELKGLYETRSFLDRRAKMLKSISKAEYLKNMSKIDTAMSKTESLYKDVEKAIALFQASKRAARVEGGRKESKSERFEI